MRPVVLLATALTLPFLHAGLSAAGREARPPAPAVSAEDLGRRLFHDTLLSASRSQSCATCHDPAHAFTDPRPNATGRAVSQGDDGRSHGDRHTPSLSYAFLSPAFHTDEKGRHKGGQFWDGRARDLREQAALPILNPDEMGMPDAESVVARLRADPQYPALFDSVYGSGSLHNTEQAFGHLTDALARYQQTPEFAPFDSKFDRYLRGEAELTAQEKFGHTVYLTWNCRLCHQLNQFGVTERETFTSFEYHNIGLAVHPGARRASGKGEGYADGGLALNPRVSDEAARGRFKVPTLRNVAVTAPYMHNGLFQDLRTAVVFYNKYTSRRASAQINPETGADWGPPEIAENLSLPELRSGLMLDEARIDALVAFLRTLTDQRYEHLLPPL